MIVPEHISKIQPYIPGRPLEELERELGISEAVKLASNENPLGPSPEVKDAIAAHVSGINRYPDGGGFYLRNALSGKLGVKPDQIVLGNGSNELIEIAARAFLLPGENAVMAAPSFVIYDSVVRAAGGESLIVPLKDGRHDLPRMAAAVTDRTRMVFVANPNNPTGTIVSHEEVVALLSALPDNCLLVMDEAYYEYVAAPDYPDSPGLLGGGRDLLILRTFSKAYGIAGLRVGYGMGPVDVVETMNRIRQPFNCNGLAQAAALAALRSDAHMRKVVEINREGRQFLALEFDRLGIGYFPTEANFFYVKLPRGQDPSDVFERLLRAGVIVRPAGPAAVRVTIGLPDENRRFISAFENLLSQA